MVRQVVIDTNVFVSALISNRGASHRLISLLGDPRFVTHVSVPLVLEYEEVLKRMAGRMGLTHRDIDDVLDYVCSVAHHHSVYFLWRPFLKDPDDDLVLELAVEAGCDTIVTHNVRDFDEIEKAFGVLAAPPRDFLKSIGALR